MAAVDQITIFTLRKQRPQHIQVTTVFNLLRCVFVDYIVSLGKSCLFSTQGHERLCLYVFIKALTHHHITDCSHLQTV